MRVRHVLDASASSHPKLAYHMPTSYSARILSDGGMSYVMSASSPPIGYQLSPIGYHPILPISYPPYLLSSLSPIIPLS